jgi:predicted phosphoadenosine phosphosulfate sulfurtransferase
MTKPRTSRKFMLAVGCIAIATGLLLYKSIDGGQWVDVVKWVTGLYMAGNVGEKYAGKAEVKP